MAIYIKPIPTLRGKLAERFNRTATENATKKRASIDFTKQVEVARSILSKSKFNR